MFKKIFIIMAVLITCAGAGIHYYVSKAQAQTPLVVTEIQQLSFGTILVDNNRAVVKVNRNGTIQINSGNVVLLGGHSRGEMRVDGDPNATLVITLENTVFLSGPGEDIELDNLRHSRVNNPNLNGSGTRTFNIGGVLRINNNQTGGTYSGTYLITFNYP